MIWIKCWHRRVSEGINMALGKVHRYTRQRRIFMLCVVAL
jgi:hypothetical protein